MKKRLMTLLLSVLMVFSMAPTTVWAADITIDAARFPDEGFRQYVETNFDTDQDNVLSEEEIAAVTQIEVYGQGISSLKGIEYFTNLQTLDCSNNQLTQLDVSHNTKLQKLNCSVNQLSKLDLSNLTSLDSLSCYTNQLSELDVSHNTNLQTLDCYENQLSQLDLSHNTNLQTLDCFINQLSKLDLPHNTNLQTLNCYKNKLTQLDVSGNTGLESLTCSENQLSELDVSRNTSLESLTCSENQLSELDVSRNTSLESLTCDTNKLTQLDVSGNTSLESLSCHSNKLIQLDVSKNTNLYLLDCSNNQLSQLDVSNIKNLQSLSCYNNQLTQLDVSSNTNLTYLYCPGQTVEFPVQQQDDGWTFDLTSLVKNPNKLTITSVTDATQNGMVFSWQDAFALPTITYTYDTGYHDETMSKMSVTIRLYASENSEIYINETNFPDDAFRQYVLDSMDTNQDGKLSPSERVVNAIYVNYQEVKSLKGIEYFPLLDYLNCSDNQLSELDLSSNPNLQTLDCSNNQLSELDLFSNPNLQTLYCSNNQLSELDLSSNPNLQTLYCYDNQLTQLDLSSNPNLQTLYCSDQTVEFSVQQQDGGWTFDLASLVTDTNKLTITSVTDATQDDMVFSWKDMFAFPSITYTYNTGYHDETMSVTLWLYASGVPTINIDETNFPDDSFRQYVLDSIDTNQDEKLSPSERVVDEIYVANQGIESLTGIEYFPLLEYLYCYDNQLTQLDVSGNTKLQTLECDNNQLSELDLSSNPNLQTLYCYDNQLTQLDLFSNPNLQTLYCYDNRLTQLDLSSNPNLQTLYCDNNQLTQLDVSHNTNLQTLYCYNNQLTQLNLSSNPNLQTLYCDNNQLSELDLSSNPNLQTLYCYDNQLTQLDVSSNTKLQTLECDNNQLAQLNTPHNAELEYLTCSENQLTQLDVTGNPNLQKLECSNNQLTQLDVTGNPNLQKLECYDNQLTQLDLSSNPNLQTLYCYDNRLTQLDVTGNPNLQKLECSNNQLTQLDVTGNPNLQKLDCSNNQLLQLDLSEDTSLKEFSAEQEFMTLEVTRQEDRSWCFDLATLVDTSKILKVEVSDPAAIKIDGTKVIWTDSSIIPIITYVYNTGHAKTFQRSLHLKPLGLSTDATLTSVMVDGIEGVISGTKIQVTLPDGSTLPTDSSRLSITPADGAVLSKLESKDNGATWTFVVTSEDGSNVQSYTLLIHVHSWSKTWTTNDTHHWHQCEAANCFLTDPAQMNGYGPHSGGEATCTEPAVCEVCGQKYGKTNPSHHDLTAVEAKKPTPTEAGNIGYWYCADCKKYFRDADATEEITLVETILPVTSHNLAWTEGKDPTCTEDGNIGYWYCGDCKKYFRDASAKEEITLEETVLPATGHDLTKVEAKKPTPTEAGNIEYWHCENCGKYFRDAGATEEITLVETILPVTSHDLTWTEAKDPTCTEDGNIGYWHCADCGKYFRDASAKEEITLEEIILPATSHTLTKVEAKDPTCTQEGYTGDMVCTVCGKVVEQGETIPKMAHDYQNGVCTVCGAVEPDYKPVDNTPSPETGSASHTGLWITFLLLSGSFLGITIFKKKEYTR